VKIFSFLCKWFEGYYIRRSKKRHSTDYLLFVWFAACFVLIIVSLLMAIFWLPIMGIKTIGENIEAVANSTTKSIDR
jgi:phosphotransferase system  glucose/maltose/N-acetylglucosamine-specific IIC component